MPNSRGRTKFQPRFWLLCVALLFMIFIPLFRSQNGNTRTQTERLTELKRVQYEAEMYGEKLKYQLENAESAGFRERVARQQYDYAMPGGVRFMAEPYAPAGLTVDGYMEWADLP